MSRRVYSFEDPDPFVAGAIGQPGKRTFYLQARDGARTISVVLEKEQVALLAERLSQLLTEVRERGANVPPEPGPADLDAAPLDEPIDEKFHVGTMAIVWDGDDDSVVIEARALTEDEEASAELDVAHEADEAEEAYEIDEIHEVEDDGDEEEDETEVVRVRLEPGRALAFAARAMEVVAAGRPPCPFCGQPLNPEGHLCPRRNGFMH